MFKGIPMEEIRGHVLEGNFEKLTEERFEIRRGHYEDKIVNYLVGNVEVKGVSPTMSVFSSIYMRLLDR